MISRQHSAVQSLLSHSRNSSFAFLLNLVMFSFLGIPSRCELVNNKIGEKFNQAQQYIIQLSYDVSHFATCFELFIESSSGFVKLKAIYSYII
jgi:hypothetical protein